MPKKDTKKSLDIKLATIKTIVTALEKITPEERNSVIDFVCKEIGVDRSSQPTGADVSLKGEIPGPKVDIDKFVKEKKPADQYQRVAVLAYYLKHFESTDEFKNKEIASANLRARQSRIGNLADVISKADTRYHFLTKGIAIGTRQLSTHGEEVVEAMPDQEKIKTLIKSFKTRKPRRKSSKKSKTGK